jgi:hypothetical protein
MKSYGVEPEGLRKIQVEEKSWEEIRETEDYNC